MCCVTLSTMNGLYDFLKTTSLSTVSVQNRILIDSIVECNVQIKSIMLHYNKALQNREIPI